MSLRWNAVTGASGYRIYYGTSHGSYTNTYDVGPATSATLNGLADCTTYYAAVKSYNGAGESVGFSNEISGWARPRIVVHTPAYGTGTRIPLTISGANFESGATLLFESTSAAGDGPSIATTSQTTVSCHQIQTTIDLDETATATLAGVTFRVRNPSGVISEARTIPLVAALSADGWTVIGTDSQQLVGFNAAASNAIDGNPATLWHTEWFPAGVQPPHEIVLDRGTPVSVAGFSYLPNQVASSGSIGQYALELSLDGAQWTPVAGGRLISDVVNRDERAVTFPATWARYARLRAMSEAGGGPWASAAELAFSEIEGNRPPAVALSAPSGDLVGTTGVERRFTTSASDPDGDAPLTYAWSFPACATPTFSDQADAGNVRFTCQPGEYAASVRVCDARGLCTSAERRVSILATGCQLLPASAAWASASDEESTALDARAYRAVDGNPQTFWHSRYTGGAVKHAHLIDLHLNRDYDICGFAYLPRQDGVNGRIRHYELEVSGASPGWTRIGAGVLADRSSGVERIIALAPVRGRHIRLRTLSEVNGGPWASVAELRVYARTGNLAPAATIDAPPAPAVVASGEALVFAGATSDPEGSPVTSTWTFPACAAAPQTNVANPGSVVFDCPPGAYQASLRACDAGGACSISTRAVTVLASGCAPLARTGWTIASVTSEEHDGGDWSAARAIDGDTQTLWHTARGIDEPPHPHAIVVDVGQERDLCGFGYVPRQDSGTTGIVRDYALSLASRTGTSWIAIADGTFVLDPADRSARVVALPSTRSARVRLQALSDVGGGPWASAAELMLYARQTNASPILEIDAPSSGSTQVGDGDTLLFTASATDPEGDAPISYRWTFPACANRTSSTAQDAGLVRFDCTAGSYPVTLEACDRLGACTSESRTVTVVDGCVPLTTWTWRVVSVDSEELVAENGLAENAFDGDPSTMWHTAWYPMSLPPPHEMVIDLGAPQELCSFGYLPRQDGLRHGTIRTYELAVSTNGTSWTTVVAGQFPDSPPTVERSVSFPRRVGRFVRVRAMSEVDANPWTSVAELRLDAE